MPSKTEVSERAKRAAQELGEATCGPLFNPRIDDEYGPNHDYQWRDAAAAIIDRHFAGHQEALELCATVVRWWHNEIPNHPEDRAKMARQAYAALRRAGMEPVEERK